MSLSKPWRRAKARSSRWQLVVAVLAVSAFVSGLGVGAGMPASTEPPPPPAAPKKHVPPIPYSGSAYGGLKYVGPVAVNSNATFVAFATRDRLDAHDTNSTADVYRYHIADKKIELVSVRARTGKTADALWPSISRDGRYVAFQSTDLSLVASDPNPATGSHVFLRDMIAGTTEVVSGARGTVEPVTTERGSFAPAISDDGRWVAFVSVTPKINSKGPLADGKTEAVFEWSAASKDITLVSRGHSGSTAVLADKRSDQPAVSADGRFVVFESAAKNLVEDADKNDAIDVFLWDRENPDAMKLVSISTTGKSGNGASGGPSISSNGIRIAFISKASDLIGPDQAADLNQRYDAFVRDMQSAYTGRISLQFFEKEKFLSSDPAARSRQWFESKGADSVVISVDGSTAAIETDASLLYVHGNGAIAFSDDNEAEDVYWVWLRADKPLPYEIQPVTVAKTVQSGQCDFCDPAWYTDDWFLNGVTMAGGSLAGSRSISSGDATIVVTSESTALLASTSFHQVWNQVYWWCTESGGVCEDPTVPNREIYIKYDVEKMVQPPDLDPETHTYYLDGRYREGWTNLPGWYSGDFADGGIGPYRFVIVTPNRYKQLYQKIATWPTADATGGKTDPVFFEADGVNQ